MRLNIANNFHSSIATQITELATRMDNMEVSIKRDIRHILEILQNPSGDREKPIEAFEKQYESHPQVKEQQTQEKQSHLMTSSMQPSESDFSFELCLDKRPPAQSQQRAYRTPSTGGSQVHRSISQPECTNTTAEKNLMR